MANGEDKPWQTQSRRSRGSPRAKVPREELTKCKRQGDRAGQGAVNREGVGGRLEHAQGDGLCASEMGRPGEFSEGEGRRQACDEDGLPGQGSRTGSQEQVQSPRRAGEHGLTRGVALESTERGRC